jgi:CBS-domain-containing membrane protein
MELTLHIPDEVAKRLAASWSDLSRRALEAFALEEYKAGRLTDPRVRQLLGFETRDKLDGFLKAHEVWLDFTREDLERERAALRRLGFGN